MPARRAKASIETKAPEPAPAPPPPVAVREVEPAAAPTPPAPVMRPAPALTPPAAPRPAVSVGAFDTPSAVAPATPPPQRVEAAGFNLPAAEATQSRLAPASIGTFDSRPAADRRPADRVNTVVADSGFGEANTTPRPAPQSSRAIRDSGFGAAASGRAETRAGAVAASAGFADARAVEQTRRADAAPARPAILPVEVLSKPSPAYTDEARRLKIEGDVVLEVEFSTAGTVRVLRIVRGLGYGLDESATTAAQKIQFKPATSEGRPVDYKTTVRIEFRLA
jgi:TonB family protein